MEIGQQRVRIGPLLVGPSQPVMIQSMTNVSTLDTAAIVEQCIRIFDAGASLVRITTRNLQEARNLQHIRRQLNEQGYEGPLSADVHFNPSAAFEAARWVEKVRINPGNFAGTGPRRPLRQLIEVCRRHHTALRIGVNHGSLSERIMERYGDSPEGMVASAMEYLEICREEQFHQVVISLKSSNTRIMVYANRMMHRRMEEAGMSFPLHLGVTEAGAGMEGRIRSAVGIGTLLREGLGDTIRVSLTEDPEKEIPVAKKLVRITAGGRKKGRHETGPESFERRLHNRLEKMGGNQVPVVLGPLPEFREQPDAGPAAPEPPDYCFIPDHRLTEDPPGGPCILNAEAWIRDHYPEHKYFPFYTLDDFLSWERRSPRLNFVLLAPEEVDRAIRTLPGIEQPFAIVFLHDNAPGTWSRFMDLIDAGPLKVPVLIRATLLEKEMEDLSLSAAAGLGRYFLDGYADGIWLDAPFQTNDTATATAFRVLQACRSRVSETEYIACPSCGRTHFDIQASLEAVKGATSHLRHLKIAVMGCIVNGPGEMADADYGYVGSGPGKVSLYRGKKMVKKNIPAADAVRELVHLIKSNDDWKEPAGTHRHSKHHPRSGWRHP